MQSSTIDEKLYNLFLLRMMKNGLSTFCPSLLALSAPHIEIGERNLSDLTL